MEKQVTRCEECPMFSIDIDDSEYCSAEGKPESRYPQGDPWEEKLIKKDIPIDCPLLKESITIKLKV